MQKVTLDEIIGAERYEKIRDDFRRRIIALKKPRRLAVGDRMTFVFENHDTVLFQIQEMLRAERITDIDKIRFEIDTYNELIPQAGEFSATLLIEITQQEKIRLELIKLIGIEKAVALQIGQHFTVPGIFEGGRSTEENLSAVQYVRFSLSPEARTAFKDTSQAVRLVITHPHYQAQCQFPEETRTALAAEI